MISRHFIAMVATLALVCAGAPSRAEQPAPRPPAPEVPEAKDADRPGKCLPNQILMPDGSCESRGGLAAEEKHLLLPEPFMQSHELDAITGMDVDDSIDTSDLEEVETFPEFKWPNQATTATVECPLRYTCRQMPSDPKERCLQAVGGSGFPTWVGLPRGGLEDPPAHPEVQCTGPTMPAKGGGCEEYRISPDEEPRTVQLDTVGYVDLLAMAHTCIDLHGDILKHLGFHRAKNSIDGSRLMLRGTGSSRINELKAFEGIIVLNGIAQVNEIKRGPKGAKFRPAIALPAKRMSDVEGGALRIEGPTQIGLIDYHGQLSLKNVTVDRLVLDGSLHLERSTIRRLHWRDGNQFFFGSCDRMKGCRGKVRVIDRNGTPAKTY